MRNLSNFYHALIIFLLATPALACDYVQATRVANQFADKIIENNLRSSGNLETFIRVQNCVYSRNSGWYMQAVVSWRGLFSGDYFEAAGNLEIFDDQYNWETTNANGNLMGWWVTQGVLEQLMQEMTEK